MPLVPKHIKELSPYIAGKPISEIQRELKLNRIVKLDSNENPLGPSPNTIASVLQVFNECHRYPDPNGYELRSKLAQRFDLKLDNVILGAGSEGIMSTIMRTFLRPDDEIIGARNSFIGFRVLASASGVHTNWIPMQDYHYDLSAMAGAINEYTKIIYLANPDNPTGTYFSVDEFDAFMTKIPTRVLVLLDEAYFEYANGLHDYPDSMHYRYDNVITLRTFSKAYGLAGFRVGYGFAHQDLIGNLLKVKLPFEPSAPAQLAALAAMDDEEHLQLTLNTYKTEVELVKQAFQKLGLRFIPSVANFITIVFDDPTEAQKFTAAMLKRGLVLRHLTGFGLPECVRITIGTPDENEFMIKQFNRYFRLDISAEK